MEFSCDPGHSLEQGPAIIECINIRDPYWNDTEPLCRGAGGGEGRGGRGLARGEAAAQGKPHPAGSRWGRDHFLSAGSFPPPVLPPFFRSGTVFSLVEPSPPPPSGPPGFCPCPSQSSPHASFGSPAGVETLP